MKSNALQIAKTIVSDNKQYIQGNVAEYMIQEVDAAETNFFQYLTDSEIEEMNGNAEKWKQFGDDVYNMLRENFDFDASDLITLNGDEN